MAEACMFDIIALPENDLRRVLTRASTRSIAKIVVAYPRSVGRTVINILSQTMSAPAVAFLQDVVNNSKLPSYFEIRRVESELMKIVREENLQGHAFSAPRAKPRRQ